MISEEEKQKYVEATKCSECTQWHKHCNAECCRYIHLNISLEELEKGVRFVTINPGNKFGIDDIKYYKNHDVEYIRGLLRFRKDRIQVIGKNILYFYDCKRLNGNMCLDHPDKKPGICKFITLETSKTNNSSFMVTPNCLFKYKCKEVKKDE